MNATSLIASLVLLSSACSHSFAAPQSAPVTRAAVSAELIRARAAGEICGNEAECGRAPGMAPAAVRQQTAKLGNAVRMCQNEAECDAAPARDFTVTRAQVMAEFYRARAAGEIPETEADNDIGRSLLRQRAQ